MQVPLAVSQNNQGPRARARAQVRLEEAQLDAAQQRLVGRLRLALLRLKTALKSLNIHEKAITPSLQHNLDLVLRAFTVGEVNLNTVSLMRARLLQATDRTIAARRRYALAAAQAEAVVGHDLFPAPGSKR